MRLLVVLVLLAGCSHAHVDASGQTSVHLESRSLAAVVLAGMFLAAAVEDVREERAFPSFSVFSDWFRGTPKPELDPERRVSEQDCTRPVELAGNLKCR
jgi:hypothetical protein